MTSSLGSIHPVGFRFYHTSNYKTAVKKNSLWLKIDQYLSFLIGFYVKFYLISVT
jgi:hypothetical protein